MSAPFKATACKLCGHTINSQQQQWDHGVIVVNQAVFTGPVVVTVDCPDYANATRVCRLAADK